MSATDDPQLSAPLVFNAGEGPPFSSPPVQDSRRDAFYQICPLPLDVPSIPNSFSERIQLISNCFRRMQKHCTLCYFLRRINPVKIIQTSRGTILDTLYDHHANDFERCPSRLINPSSPYHNFTCHISALMRCSFSGGAGWFVCTICAEPYDDILYHERCIYGRELFLLAYLIWEHPPTLGRVFSLLRINDVTFPNFQNITEYAQWLGNGINLTRPVLNNIHLVIIAYHLLRWVGQLPRLDPS
ncbi:hypothetical protein J3R83DRAFT_10945 [Lanmaoa asiatica]|nr:hypothetical protein J3R83DRAFT_10945 [Lanmaoa asiatica]